MKLIKKLLKEIKGLQKGTLMAHADGSVTECILSPDCKCEDCKKETEEMNTGGADRW